MRPMTYKTIESTVGHTPLVRLQRLPGNTTNTILVKLEGNNPAGSVKDRPALNMIIKAEQRGEIKPGDTLIEATSGNTGIALAMAAAMRGYKMKLIMPANQSQERRDAMAAYGAELISVTKEEGMEGARDLAQAMQARGEGRVLDQFANPDNPLAHYESTGPEIWEATGGDIDVLVSGVGTGGTITGVSRYIKNQKGKAITSIAVEPDSSTMITAALKGEEPTHGPHKIQGIGAGFVPKNLDLSVVDRCEQVSNDDAMAWAHKLMQEEGILAGISCGAAMCVADRISQLPEFEGKTIVVVLPDSGERYLSSPLFADMFSEQELNQ